MSCYLRHMRDLFEVLGLEYDQTQRARVDAAIRTVTGVPDDAGCPQVWAAVKAMTAEQRDSLPEKVSRLLS